MHDTFWPPYSASRRCCEAVARKDMCGAPNPLSRDQSAEGNQNNHVTDIFLRYFAPFAHLILNEYLLRLSVSLELVDELCRRQGW